MLISHSSASGRFTHPDADSYDVPPQPAPVSPAPPCESYDVPRPLMPALTPSSSLSSLTTDSLSAGSNRSSLAQEYDVPRPRPGPLPQLHQQVRLEFQTLDQCGVDKYFVQSRSTSSYSTSQVVILLDR